MIDFTNCKELLNTYGGSEKKKKIIFNDEIYLLKFPDPIREKNKTLSYVNNQFSEYIGCHIFKELGIKVQDTILGIYKDGDKEKVCVACRDFANDKMELIEFSKLANSITSSDVKFSTNIEDIYEIIKQTAQIKDKNKIIDGFWDIFVIDLLIGNKDRHLENWGIAKLPNGDTTISPVYDCGSCFFPLYSKEEVEELLSNKTELKNKAYNVKSVYKLNGSPIFYRDIGKIDNIDLKNAILRIGKRIDLDKLKEVINKTPFLSSEYKECFIIAMEIRYKEIFKKVFDKIKDSN